MNHLERLLAQYYEWQGYIVRANTLVGKRAKGGYECELDICAYNPQTQHLIHFEPSLDADTWEKRRMRFAKKFEAGQKYIKTTVFPWLEGAPVEIEHVAVLVASSQSNPILAGGRVVNLDELVLEIKSKIINVGIMAKNAIPERYDLLRTLQLALCGYYRVV
ncbi:hypothetical protein [Cupriavidus necator]|uniref:hypothetical protein n=1 Tax=Cupriavidus necator TaxID=106590 RepID=UPI003F733B04